MREFLKQNWKIVLVILFVLFIWPTPFETKPTYSGGVGIVTVGGPVPRTDVNGSIKVWRFTGTPAPWE